jgi:hypothetical protein
MGLKFMDHRAELIKGAQESLERDQAKLDYHAKTGYYTLGDVRMFTRGIEHCNARIQYLTNCTGVELTADLSR